MFSIANLENAFSVIGDALAIKSAPGSTTAATAETDLAQRATTILTGVAATSPKAAAIVSSVVNLGEQVAAHPQPGALLASFFNVGLTSFGSSFQF